MFKYIKENADIKNREFAIFENFKNFVSFWCGSMLTLGLRLYIQANQVQFMEINV